MSSANDIRQKIWAKLSKVAFPDSRFHLNFSEVIPDFEGSQQATDRLLELPFIPFGKYAFITPDNGLVDLRRRLLEMGVTLVVSTYGIRRGFILVEPSSVPAGQELFAAWLDGLEYFGRPISLRELKDKGRFDFMVTGASAVSLNGVRFGKGHGFFDLEWGMFTDVGVVDERTPVVAMVHDIQTVAEDLTPSATDIIVDYIATPERLCTVQRSLPRPHGIHWNLLDAETIAATPPLEELRDMQRANPD